jgi:PAS domain S-box-containing protein
MDSASHRPRPRPPLAWLAVLAAAAAACLAAQGWLGREVHPLAGRLAQVAPLALALAGGAMLGGWAARAGWRLRRRGEPPEQERPEERLRDAERRAGELEGRLRESEERTQLAMAASGAEPVEWDLGTGAVTLGPAMRQLVGERPIRLRPGELQEIVHADDAPALLRALDDVLAGRSPVLEAQGRVTNVSGGLSWLEIRGKVVQRDEAGRPLRLAGAIRDVTEQRNLAARLEVADRLAAMGTLAAGLGHEINNPLAYLAANLAFVREQLGELSGARELGGRVAEMRQALDEAVEGAARVRDIVQGLRRFSRPGPGGRRRVNPRREIEAALQLARNEVSHRARLVVDVAELPRVEAAEHELGQVFLNLLLNAAQAIPEGRASENEVRVTGGVDGQGRVVVEVRDTGTGIPPENLRRIFDPFFTTKAVGQGTGLGLSICHGIVSGLGGAVEVESTPGQGSLFRVVLPAADPPHAPSDTPPSEEPPAPPRRGRILVVDDEPLVGRAVARLLGSDHEVLTLTSPAEALDRAAAGERWDVVLCDLMMPEMDGALLARRLEEKAPDLAQRIVYMTGGAFIEGAGDVQRDLRPRLSKPLDPLVLRALVADLLDSGTPLPE